MIYFLTVAALNTQVIPLLHNFDKSSKLVAGKRPCLYPFFFRLFQLTPLSWETGQACLLPPQVLAPP